MKVLKKYGKPPRIFKIDISSMEYKLLIRGFTKVDIKEMLYFYFDTSFKAEKAKIFKANSRLRVRVKGKKYSLELKNHPAKDFSQTISLSEFALLFQGTMPKGIIRNRLLELNLPDQVLLIGVAHTTRAKKSFNNGVLILDKTSNCQKASYQIEFRSDNPISAQELQIIKKNLDISDHLAPISKVKRIWTE